MANKKKNGRQEKVSSNPLIEAISKLPPTGVDGFEGLLCDLLSALTKQPFRIMKSSHQGGVDVLSEHPANFLSVGLEGKRYAESTQLPLDSLKAKIVDAIDTHPGLDLWILATTRSVSATDQQALQKWGDKLGLAVEIVDWPQSPNVLPRLAVLAAAESDVTRRLLGSDAQLRGYLESIAGHPDFKSTRARLVERFTASDIGYAAARQHAAIWLRESMRDLRSAKARLGGYANLLDSAVHRVTRISLNERLDAWYAEDFTRPVVLLGSEGVGKTWAVLSWWEGKTVEDGTPLPLTLVIPARLMEAHDLETLLSNRLFETTGLRTSDFWSARLKLWRSAGNQQFLLLIDGLNERWQFKRWTSLLQPLYAADWRGRFAVVLTCRPDHWQHTLNELADLDPRAHEVPVAPFSQAELDDLLADYGLTCTHFSAAVLKLMLIPRLSQRAIELHKILKDAGDVTPERLFYEDWKQRLERRGAKIISDSEFKELIRSFGDRIRKSLAEGDSACALPAITRAELLSDLARKSGHERGDLVDTLSEIIDGRWLRPSGDRPHHFSVDPSLIPFVLGMALVDDLKRAEAGAIEQRLGTFLDDLRGLDLASDILRAAITVALLDGQSTFALRRQIATAWLKSQHFRRTDFDAFWRLAAAEPAFFIGLADELWTQRSAFRGHIDEMLIRGIARAAATPEAHACLLNHATVWFGTYWLDPHIGFFLSYDPSTPKATERRQETAARVLEWQKTVAPLRLDAPVCLSEAPDPEGISWLMHRAVGILSFMPRAPMIRAFIGWAVSRALMKWPNHFDEIAWLLRFNEYDPEDTRRVVLAAIRDLQSIRHPLAAQAANNLIRALATPDALEMLPETSSSPTPVGSRPRNLRSVAEEAANPDLQLIECDRSLVADAEEFRAFETLWASRSQTLNDINFDTVERTLARHNPHRLGEMLRAIAAGAATRDPEALWRLCLEAPTRLMLLDPEQRRTLSLIPVPDALQGSLRTGMVANQVMARLFDQPASDQLQVISELDASTPIPSEYQLLMAIPGRAEFEAIQQKLNADASVSTIKRWLIHLTRVSLQNLPPDFDLLLPLTNHSDPDIRRFALQVIADSEAPALLHSFYLRSWRYDSTMPREEAFLGSSIVALASKDSADPTQLHEVIDRISPEALSVLLRVHPDNETILAAYAGYVHSCVDAFSSESSPAFRGMQIDHDAALAALVRRRGDEVASWVETLIRARDASRFAPSIEDFPIVALCRALMRQGHSTGVRLWHKLWDYQGEQLVPPAILAGVAFDCPDSPDVRRVRHLVIANASNDSELQHIAIIAEHSNQTQSLIALIEADLNGQSAASHARGIALAGWLDDSPETERLWKGALKNPPAPGWLAKVHAWAFENMQRSRWAHLWFSRYMAEHDRDRAYGHSVLLAACMDRHTSAWAVRQLNSEERSLPEDMAAHLKLVLSKVPAKLSANRDRKLADTLYGEKIMKNRMSPWL